MSERDNTVSEKAQRSNRVIAVVCLAFFASMVGAAYAAVPLYQLFCQVTGYGGTTQRVTQYSQTVLDREIKVRFDANTAGGLPWDFKPVQRDVTMKIGETTQISYKAKNTFSRPDFGSRVVQRHAATRGALLHEGGMLLLHRDGRCSPARRLDHAGRLLRRSGDRQCAWLRERRYDHAVLHLLSRVETEWFQAADIKAATGGQLNSTYGYADERDISGMSMADAHTQRTTTIISSTQAHGPSSAPSARFVMAVGGIGYMQYHFRRNEFSLVR
jgi:hypothetical protein